jgi:ATP-binding cassette subfamily C protein
VSEAPGLATLRTLRGEDVPASGNTPVRLDDAGSVWLVTSGQVDVFAVAARDGTAGARFYLWSAEAGAALPGCAGAAWIAVGTPGTRLRRVRVEDLAAQAGGADGAAAVASVVEGIVAALATAAAPPAQPPYHALLSSGEQISLARGRRVGVRQGVVFVRQDGGRCRLGDDGALADGVLPLPLARGLWLTSDDDVRLVAEETAQAVARGDALPGMRRFVELVRVSLEAGIEAAEAGREERLRAKAAAEARLRGQGLFALSRLLEREPLEEAPTAGDLLAACRAVGRAAGISFQEGPRAGVPRDPLELICRASRVRSRRVALRGTWWLEDNGPLLGTLEAEGSPVALLPAPGRRYEMLDPRTRTRSAVDGAAAAALAPFAESFYRPLPDRRLTPRDLLHLAGPQIRGDLGRMAVVAAAGALLTLVLPLATGQVFSEIVPSGQPRNLALLFAALAAAALGAALFDLARGLLVVRVEGRWNAALQAALIDRLLSLPAPFFRRYPVGDLAQRAGAINAVMALLSGAAAVSLLAGVFSTANLGLLFYYDAALAQVALVTLALAVAFVAATSLLALRHERRAQEAQGRTAGLVFQMLAGVTKLRVAGAEGRAFAMWCVAFSRQKALAFRAGACQAAVKVFSDVLPLAAAGVVYGQAGSRLLGNEAGAPPLHTADFVAFNAALGAFLAAGTALSTTIMGLLAAIPLLERARPILEEVPEQNAARSDPGILSGRVEVSHVSFRYRAGGPLVLDDVSFRAAPGEFIALVGPSGSGKSTALRLLLGFEQAEMGSVSYDGRNIATLDLAALRCQQLGVVLQDSRILSGDIFRNIVGSTSLTVEDAWDAAERAGLADDIRAMPMGMQTHLSEGGSTLSGGQRQRLLIARALVRRPRIILFDEATSALDNRTQEQVTRTLELTSATRIVIAHRLSTIRRADRIYFFERGRIVQEGTFETLSTEPGPFQKLVARQQA